MGAFSGPEALETPIVFDNLGLLRGSKTGFFMDRIWRFSRQKRCFKSDTRMTKSVTPTACPGLQVLQRAVNVLTEHIGRLGRDIAKGC